MKNRNALSDQYFKKHPLQARCGAAFVYMQLTMDEELEREFKEQMKNHPMQPKNKDDQAEIDAAEDKDTLFRLMRRKMIAANRDALRHKILRHEEDMMPLIKKRLPTSRVDSFIDDSVWVFGFSRENPTPWILDHLQEIDDLFVRSQLDLILGLRGGEEVVPFLMDEVDFFEDDAIEDKMLVQGPLHGLYHIWLNDVQARTGQMASAGSKR